jgi:hypothetical protein
LSAAAYATAERLAGWLGRRRAASLAAEDPARSQRQVLERLLLGARRTAVGRALGLAEVGDRRGLRRQVPVQTYESLLPLVERALRGEADVLAPGLVRHFAVSSGTTAAPTKYLPVNAALEANFRRGGLDALLLHVARRGSGSVFGGPQLFLGGSTALEPARSDPRVLAGDLSGIMALRLPLALERWFYLPGRELALLADWPRKVRAIAERALEEDVRAVAGIPSWLLVLFEALRGAAEERGRACATLHDLWPRLELVVHGGVAFAPYRPHFERWLGRPTAFAEVYPASEGFVAVQDGSDGGGLRLLTDAGLYFEFLPLAELPRDGSPPDGRRAVGVEEVDTGVDYALLLSTPAGLWRYLIGDVVRFVSRRPPRLIFAGRTRLELSAFGEHVIEHEVAASLAVAAAEAALPVREFTVAPVFPELGDAGGRGRHEWLLELGAPLPAGVEPAALARRLDALLQERNDDYRAKRLGGGLWPPLLRLLPAGTFHGWLAAEGRLGGQHKVPRLRSDRRVADALLRAVGTGESREPVTRM